MYAEMTLGVEWYTLWSFVSAIAKVAPRVYTVVALIVLTGVCFISCVYSMTLGQSSCRVGP